MKKRFFKKGFTLTEMLATLLILSLVVGSSVTGIVAISTNYKKVLMRSNAEQLCSVLTTAMTGELTYAKYVKAVAVAPAEGAASTTRVQFYSATYRDCYYELDSNDQLVIVSVLNGTTTTKKVVADSTYADGLRINNLDMVYDATEKMFTIKLEIGDANNQKVTDTEFVVKDLNS